MTIGGIHGIGRAMAASRRALLAALAAAGVGTVVAAPETGAARRTNKKRKKKPRQPQVETCTWATFIAGFGSPQVALVIVSVPTGLFGYSISAGNYTSSGFSIPDFARNPQIGTLTKADQNLPAVAEIEITDVAGAKQHCRFTF